MAISIENHLRRYGMLDIGFIMYILYFISPLTFELFNFSIVRLSHLLLALGLITIGTVWLFFRDHSDYLIKPTARFYVLFIAFAILAILAKSIFLDKNDFNLMYVDLESALLFLCGLMFGVNRQNWNYIIRLYLWILIIGIITNLLAIPFLQSLGRTDAENSLLNKMQGLLFPATFFIYLVPFSPKKTRFVYLVAFILLFVDQLLFQKRLPILRILTTIVVFSIMMSGFRKTPGLNYIVNVMRNSLLLLGVISIVVLIAVMAGFNLDQSYSNLMHRFTSSGSVAQTAIEDGRYQLALNVFYKIIASGNFLFGQGFGGVLSGGMIYWTLETSSSIQKFSTNSIEVGQIWPIWKGGIIFWLVITFTFLYGIFRFKSTKGNYLAMSCWAFSLITWLFFFGENFWHTPLFVFLIGCCLGYLLNRNLAPDNTLNRT
jgi:hypothetical protein